MALVRALVRLGLPTAKVRGDNMFAVDSTKLTQETSRQPSCEK